MPRTPLGIAMLVNLSRQAQAVRERYAFLQGMYNPDNAVFRQFSSGSFIPGAGNTSCLKHVRDIGTIIQGLDAAEDNKQVVIDNAYQVIDLKCTNAFLFTPALALVENGESIAQQNGNESDAEVDLDGSINGVFSHKFGTMVISRRVQDNGADVWLANVTVDITAECKKYARQMIKDQLNEQPLKGLLAAGHTLTEAVAQTVTDYELLVIHYHMEDSKIVGI